MNIAFVFVTFFILILALSSENFIYIENLFPHMDKVKHIIAFFTLSFFFFKSFNNLNNKYKLSVLIIFACVLEVLQSFVGREASILDVLASFIGIFIYLCFSKIKNKINF